MERIAELVQKAALGGKHVGAERGTCLYSRDPVLATAAQVLRPVDLLG